MSQKLIALASVVEEAADLIRLLRQGLAIDLLNRVKPRRGHRRKNDEIRMSNDELMTKPERVKTIVSSFAILSSHNPVMLSEAKRLRLFSPGEGPNENDQRLRETEGLRMTVSGGFVT